MFYPLTAFLTLFANILQNPKGSYVEADSRLMNIIADFFFISMTDYDDTPLELAGRVFHKLSSITAQFLAKILSQKRATKRGYEMAQDEPPVQEHNNRESHTSVSQGQFYRFFMPH
jgi:hypothetical protein